MSNLADKVTLLETNADNFVTHWMDDDGNDADDKALAKKTSDDITTAATEIRETFAAALAYIQMGHTPGAVTSGDLINRLLPFDPRFVEWAAQRKRVPDLVAVGFDELDAHVDADKGPVAGVTYPNGWIVDYGEQSEAGRYWTVCSNDDVMTDDLAEAERFLWLNHARFEV